VYIYGIVPEIIYYMARTYYCVLTVFIFYSLSQTCTHALGNKYKCLVSKLIRASMTGGGGGGGITEKKNVGGGGGGEGKWEGKIHSPNIFAKDQRGPYMFQTSIITVCT
jgi:hypothetical protein